LFNQLKLAGRFVVQYSGNMGLWHDIDAIVRSAALLKHRGDIVFLFVGGGMRKAAAQSLAQELQLPNVLWLPYQPIENLADSLGCCHVALISQREGLEGVAVPCKLYGILASGRPIIAQVPTNSEVARVIREEDCGAVIAPGDSEGLAREVERMADDPARRQAAGLASRRAYQMKYTVEKGAERFSGGWLAWQS
jgi:glycosyltransferase involved in cell wall biosynthesis